VALSPVERFVLMLIYHEYGGKIYYQSGSQSPEEYLARFLAEDFLDEKSPNFERVVKGFAEALKGLKEKGMIEISGYEVKVTDTGIGEALAIPLDEYRKLKSKFMKA